MVKGSLGWNQCRWGYKSISEIEGVVANYSKYEIPLEVQWSDIDYMDHHKDFTFDPVNFPIQKVKQFVDELHQKEMKFVLIFDPGIKNETGYIAYELGLKKDIFIKNSQGGLEIGLVWPGYTTFPGNLHHSFFFFFLEPFFSQKRLFEREYGRLLAHSFH